MSLDHEGIYAALFAEAKKPSARLCLLLEITPDPATGKPTLRFTDHDQTVEVEDGSAVLEYLPALGFTGSAFENAVGGSTANASMIGLTSTALPEDDFLRGRYNNAEMTVKLAAWGQPTIQPWTFARGWIGEITLAGGSFEAEFRGFEDALQRPVGRAYQHRCDVRRYGDARCGQDLSAVGETFDTTVAAAGATTRSFEISEAQDDDYFQFGTITFTSGRNEGWGSQVISHASDVVTTLRVPPFEVEAGDAITITRGCPRTWDACKARGRLISFRGFGGRKGNVGWFMPPAEIVAQTPDAKSE